MKPIKSPKPKKPRKPTPQYKKVNPEDGFHEVP